MKVVLVQPRSPWGKQPYLPNGLLMVAAQLMSVGVKVVILDENLGDRIDALGMCEHFADADAIGIGALGAPYVPEAIRVAERLRNRYGTPIFVGGEVINNLAPAQFVRMFGHVGSIVQINGDAVLGEKLGLALPSMYDTSMAPAIAALPERAKEAYFRKEWCLFTSQGCIFNCNFCAAAKDRRERFRDLDAFRDEVTYLAQMVRRYAGRTPRYEVYCSTLDGCQNPDEMEQTLATVTEVCADVDVFFPLRFLATATCTARAVRKDPDVLRRWGGYGLGCIGIGVDGNDPAVWARENKRHNTESVIAEALAQIARAGIQPEAFMVMGLPGDDIDAVARGMRACFRFAAEGIRPRPYLGKGHAPGSVGWKAGGAVVDEFLERPERLLELDYGGLASPATHPESRAKRWAANAAFLATCYGLKLTEVGCPTQPLFPTESVSLPWRMFGRVANRFAGQDR